MTGYELQGVSRETHDRLTDYVELLKKWNPRINLVSKSSLSEVWQRHISDSAQIFDLAPRISQWTDLGSGGGFPGLVVAVMAKDVAPDMAVTLVESDQRKGSFLRTVIRNLDLNAHVLTNRIEAIDRLNADVLSARALAPLDRLLEHADRHLSTQGLCLFPKGERWQDEVETARRSWRFTLDPIPSKTDERAVILKIEAVTRV